MPNTDISALSGQHILVVGAGKMGCALLGGWLAVGIAPTQFSVLEPNPTRALKTMGVRLGAPDVPADIVVLAIKPQLAEDVLPPLVAHLRDDTMVVSLLAGVCVRRLADLLAGHRRLVRTMPNTPAAIGQGITALYADNTLAPAQRTQADALMRAVGQTLWLDTEAHMDAATAISGSGPAYVFLLAEELAQSGVALGLSPAVASQLARQTVIGAAAMLAASDTDARVLREDVTSPGGTTEAALQVLASKSAGEGAGARESLASLMRRATKAAAARAEALSKSES